MADFYNENLRVLNFTHVDFDGVTSAIVLKNYFKNVIVEQINYGREQEIIDKCRKYQGKFDVVIFTDFCPVNIKQVKEFLKTSFQIEIPALVLDHHESAVPFNDPQNDIHINMKYSGCMLAYKYFGIKKDLTHLNELVFIANDYDMFTLTDKRAMFFNALMWKMGFDWFLIRFIKGNIKLYAEEKNYLLQYVTDVKKQYDELPLSDLPHNGCFYECEDHIAEMSHRLSKDGYDYQIIKHGRALSIRSNTDKINVVNICRTIGRGGGHKRAGGIPMFQSDDIKKLVQDICFAVEHELNYGEQNDGLPF